MARPSTVAPSRKSSDIRTLSLSVEVGEVPAPDKEPPEPPTEFRLFAAGDNDSSKGTFVFDEAAAEMVMAAYHEHGTELAADWEHAALAKNLPEYGAPASAWFALEVRNGELWATNIRWTPKADAQLRAREYRLFSPAFRVDEETARVTEVVNFALTNQPALHRLTPLMAASEQHNEEHDMPKTENDNTPCEKCATGAGAKALGVLGLRSDVSETEALSAVSALTSLRGSIRALTGKDSDTAALGVLSAWKANGDEVAALRAEMEKREAEQLSAEFQAVLDEGSKAGKLPPAERESLGKLLLTATGGKVTRDSIIGLRAHIDARTPVVTTTATAAPVGDVVVLNDLQRKYAKLAGIDERTAAEYYSRKARA